MKSSEDYGVFAVREAPDVPAEGKPILNVTVGRGGRVLDVVVEHSSGCAETDRRAVEAAKHQLFKPKGAARKIFEQKRKTRGYR